MNGAPMSEHKRRRDEIQQIKNDFPRDLPIISVHEAGHAAGHLLGAAALGRSPVEQLYFIELRKKLLTDGATSGGQTIGHTFSAESAHTLHHRVHVPRAPA